MEGKVKERILVHLTAHEGAVKKAIAVLPLVFGIYFALIKFFVSRGKYFWIIREDGPVEYATGIAYCLSCMVAISVAYEFYKKNDKTSGHLYFLLSSGFFLLFMEEISWGQRIFGVASPEFFVAHNEQQELNLHNFMTRYYLHACYIAVGFYGTFMRMVVPKRIKTWFGSRAELVFPDACLFFYFFPVFIFYLYYDYVSLIEHSFFGNYRLLGSVLHAKDQEPAEFLLSLGFLIFMVLNKYRQTAMMVTTTSLRAERVQPGVVKW